MAMNLQDKLSEGTFGRRCSRKPTFPSILKFAVSSNEQQSVQLLFWYDVVDMT
ncbi:CLUMA_CG006942, isoform A [Clunio marinus]|uniref:CLUMA_CG006942, isoform A n=1 Tax=Clunio marinus TaxID=568069 RepID=A0A1J1I3G5_9DIPT|nr:CLUMA_CG006942, isoform A [Clunio marinus]